MLNIVKDDVKLVGKTDDLINEAILLVHTLCTRIEANTSMDYDEAVKYINQGMATYRSIDMGTDPKIAIKQSGLNTVGTTLETEG